MTTSVTESWVRRWDAQQESGIPDREERFRVVGDVVGWAVGESAGRVVDLGCGPGSLTSRLAAALPRARIVGVDADPVLLELARQEGVEAVRADLTDPSWPALLPFDGPWDAAVSSTALHWLDGDGLARLYRTVAENLRPGGVFVDADHRDLDGTAALALGRVVRQARVDRAGVAGNEGWRAWWDAVRADPALAVHVDARTEVALSHGGDTGLTLGQQLAMLREAGFAEATTVWQTGDDMVVVAVR